MWRMKFEPMKPQPPVTKIFMFVELLIQFRTWAFPSLRSGRFSFWSQPSASGRLGPMPLRGGSGRHRARARPPVAPNAWQKRSVPSFYCPAQNKYINRPNAKCSALHGTIYTLFLLSAVNFLLAATLRGCPPAEVCLSQINLPGVHPGGGSGKPAAGRVAARGILPPLKINALFYSLLLNNLPIPFPILA